jgi:hypothetical protein
VQDHVVQKVAAAAAVFGWHASLQDAGLAGLAECSRREHALCFPSAVVRFDFSAEEPPDSFAKLAVIVAEDFAMFEA